MTQEAQSNSLPQQMTLTWTVECDMTTNLDLHLKPTLEIDLIIVFQQFTPTAIGVGEIREAGTTEPYPHKFPPELLARILKEFADDHFPLIESEFRQTHGKPEEQLPLAAITAEHKQRMNQLVELPQVIEGDGNLLMDALEAILAEPLPESTPKPTHPAPKGVQ